ncbi:MAG: glycerol kinase [Planctomycetota bacterium]|nr:MAG: glycerol kinase [Planctomycetota bacterium]
MSSTRFVLAVDQGTTSSRAILFDAEGSLCASAQKELRQIFPQPGWVEHDAEDIWRDTLQVCRQVMSEAGVQAQQIDSIGITNQRETAVIWDRQSGQPLAHAIVWQDRRTAKRCQQLREQGLAERIQASTGLLVDPYFSATKIEWLLQNVPGALAKAQSGQLCFGTIDAFLLWKFSGGSHFSDASNAARTMLFDIHRQQWDQELLQLFSIPESILPEVCDNSAVLATCQAEHFGAEIPIAGMAGDQQAATFGQTCFHPGMMKCTYGTGCFALLNTGEQAVTSQNRLLTTVAWRLDGKATYAEEGSVFNAGTTIQWLRDELKLFSDAKQTQAMAEAADPARRVYLVPAFTGLGAPYWDAEARGAVFGLTRDAGAPELVRAGLEAVCHQTRDLLQAMAADGANPPTELRVDGGMVANDWAMQFLADILALPVARPRITETTALGAASLAGLATGFYSSTEVLRDHWQCDRLFEPAMSQEEREERYQGWLDAVQRVRSG